MCFLLLLFVFETQWIATGHVDKRSRFECSCPTYCYQFDTFWTCWPLEFTEGCIQTKSDAATNRVTVVSHVTGCSSVTAAMKMLSWAVLGSGQVMVECIKDCRSWLYCWGALAPGNVFFGNADRDWRAEGKASCTTRVRCLFCSRVTAKGVLRFEEQQVWCSITRKDF